MMRFDKSDKRQAILSALLKYLLPSAQMGRPAKSSWHSSLRISTSYDFYLVITDVLREQKHVRPQQAML